MIHVDNGTVHLAGGLADTVAEAMVVIQHLYEHLRFIDKDDAEAWLDYIPETIRYGAKKAPTYDSAPEGLYELDDEIYERMLGDEDDADS